MQTIRKTRKRSELDALWAHQASLALLVGFSTFDAPGVANGTTAGNLRTTATANYRIGGRAYTRAAADDLWDLSAEVDTAAATYRAYWLYVDAAGAASFAAGTDAPSAALALEALPPIDETKGILGAFVAGPATDFDAGGGLAAQGDLHDGIPTGAAVGVPRHGYTPPQGLSLVSP